MEVMKRELNLFEGIVPLSYYLFLWLLRAWLFAHVLQVLVEIDDAALGIETVTCCVVIVLSIRHVASFLGGSCVLLTPFVDFSLQVRDFGLDVSDCEVCL